MDLQSSALFAPTGTTDHSKIIVIFHGNIIGQKYVMNFPYNRLIYYVSKNTSLLPPSYLEYIPQLICGGKSTLITHKIPTNKQLITWKQLMSVNPETDLLNGFSEIMGIYYCDNGKLPVKIFSWWDLYNFTMNDIGYQNIKSVDGGSYNGILLEYLLFLIVSPILINYKIDPNIVDINVYSCRSTCNSNFTSEQVSTIGQIPQFGGQKQSNEIRTAIRIANHDLINVNEDEFKEYLSSCIPNLESSSQAGGIVLKYHLKKTKKTKKSKKNKKV
jgi:hypothetical protein